MYLSYAWHQCLEFFDRLVSKLGFSGNDTDDLYMEHHGGHSFTHLEPEPVESTLSIRFKKLSPYAVKPVRATDGSAGWDLTAASITIADSNCIAPACVVCGTGIAVEIPAGYVGLLFPRSSVVRTGLMLSNCVGVIDSDYRGEILMKFYVNPSMEGSLEGDMYHYDVGDRVGQLIILPYPDIEFSESDTLSETLRGDNGYGSTGR